MRRTCRGFTPQQDFDSARLRYLKYEEQELRDLGFGAAVAGSDLFSRRCAILKDIAGLDCRYLPRPLDLIEADDEIEIEIRIQDLERLRALVAPNLDLQSAAHGAGLPALTLTPRLLAQRPFVACG
ncbi:uncharacterized protein E1O_06310 [Burkholderiales bacterium GJ-E10]|nr:uncharacterized protein E1O_06310 [Burkholderiales bacterium GJ-E10]